MRIGINCRSFTKKHSAGIGRYAFNLVKSLATIDRDNQYELYLRKNFFDWNRTAPKPPASNFAVRVDYFNRGPEKILQDLDVFHSPSPDDMQPGNAKLVVTIHDLIHRAFPEAHTQETKETVERQIQTVVKKAARIICCSQSTVDDLERFYDVDAEKIRLIYQGVDKEVFRPLSGDEVEQARQRVRSKGVREPFMLFVGTREPRKNLKNLLKAFALLKDQHAFAGQLAVIGMRGWKMEQFEENLRASGVGEHCVFPGYISDEELAAFYNLAEIFVFPSFYEGFGFPIVEAMSCGSAVITSNVASCAEIAQEAALTVDPADPEAIGTAMMQLLQDQNLKQDLRQKALNRAKMFSFKNTAEETLEVYQSAAESV